MFGFIKKRLLGPKGGVADAAVCFSNALDQPFRKKCFRLHVKELILYGGTPGIDNKDVHHFHLFVELQHDLADNITDKILDLGSVDGYAGRLFQAEQLSSVVVHDFLVDIRFKVQLFIGLKRLFEVNKRMGAGI